MSWYDPRDWGMSAEGGLSGFAGGGLLGGALGAFGIGTGSEAGDQLMGDRDRMLAFEQEMAGRQNPQLGPAGQAGVSDFRADQRDLVGRLQAMASGKGPSLAQEQLRQGVDRATNQQYAMAAGARGNAGMAQRNAMNNAGMMQSQAAGQGALARAAEQLGALSQLGSATGQGRSMDDAQSQFNTGQQNQVSLAQHQGNLMSQAQRDALRLQAMSGASGIGMQALQQPNFWDKLGAYGQGVAQTIGGAATGGAGGAVAGSGAQKPF
jgi:hypothetical protein